MKCLFKKAVLLFVITVVASSVFAQQIKIPQLLYGVAYYDEYMPYDRLDKDVQMMKDAGINVVRIAESTWSTVEPQDNVFDFSHIDRVLNAMHKAGIKVIVGTPTYAVPTWLVKKYPDVLAITPNGPNRYGVRQNMDISNKHFLFHAERVIRKIMEHVKDHPAIIGYQLDNETKPYNTAGPDVQAMFVEYMKKKFISLDSINKAFGLDYWSNRINSWNDFPSMTGSINASQNAEFAKFQRKLVVDYLAWQAAIVNEYKKPGQFTTHNFDFEWRGFSYGIQPEVDHFASAKALDIAGADIYHPSQEHLTGLEISFGGDVARSMKQNNYFIIETEAQGFPQWTPYPGQLRLQAFSHLASGANMVEYWHWHSIHNSAETYWKGVLSHDLEPNAVYEEAKTIGKDFQRLSPQLVNIKKANDVAILFSNEALTAFNQFAYGAGSYNDVLRSYYDALYNRNVGVDFVDASNNPAIEKYKLIIVPALYAAPDSLLQRLNQYVKNGGHVIYTFKTGFSNQNVKVRSTKQPGIIGEACGIYYNEFSSPENVSLKGELAEGVKDSKVSMWMELIMPTTAKVLAMYDHPVWNKYAAITENKYGKGTATYIGCMPSTSIIDKVLTNELKRDGLWQAEQQLQFPVITKMGINEQGKTIRYLFNYSGKPVTINYPFAKGRDLLKNELIAAKSNIELAPWDVKIIEE